MSEQNQALPIAGCPCCHCRDSVPYDGNPFRPSRRLMVLCPQCGNKRCPHAEYHGNVCTASNEPGQVGQCSVGEPPWPPVEAQVKQSRAEAHRCPTCGYLDPLTEVDCCDEHPLASISLVVSEAKQSDREITAEEREAQRRSFAYGNANLANQDVTREVVDKAAEELAAPAASQPPQGEPQPREFIHDFAKLMGQTFDVRQAIVKLVEQETAALTHQLAEMTARSPPAKPPRRNSPIYGINF